MSAYRNEPDASQLAARARAVCSFAGFAAGIWLGGQLAGVTTAAWAGVAALLAGAAFVCRGKWAIAALALSMAGMGGATWSARVHDRAPDSLAAMLPSQPGEPRLLVEVEGIVLGAPDVRHARRGVMHDHVPEFKRREDGVRFEVGVELVHAADGSRLVSGVALVYAKPPIEVRAGDRVRVRGFAQAGSSPMNPGEPDYTAHSRESGDRFMLFTGDASQVRVIDHPTSRSRMIGTFRRWLSLPRRSARELIRRATDDTDGGALVRALILGERDGEGPGLAGAFRRIGLAHLLSVSGFHVALMAFIALLAVRTTGDRGWAEPVIVACAVAVYMLIVPARAPIVRAGLMVLALLLSDALGRRHDKLAVLGWVGVLVLLWKPTNLYSIGFQLSFGLVAWLLVLSEARPDSIKIEPYEDRASVPLWRVALGYMRSTGAATAACWSAALPVVIYHTGAVAPLAIAATLLTVPLIIVTMWLGFALLMLGTVAPALIGPLAILLRTPSGWCAAIVRWIDAVPFATFYLPRVSVAWTVFATCAVLYVWRRGRLKNPVMWAGIAGALLWLGLESAHGTRLPTGVRARATMLSVGDGTTIVVESGGDALLWDCGSFREHIGVKTIPDACRDIGAPSVRTIVVTHANIDHYMGLLDLVPRLGVRTVVTGESFARSAKSGNESASLVLRRLGELGVRHRVAVAGDTIEIGDSTLRVLHPPRGFVARQENDASLVARLETEAATLLLTGDIQAEAMAMLMESGVDLSAEVLELPHHGSAHDAAYAFVRTVDPTVVLQSTGITRLNDPRWDAERGARAWLVTARDGAIGADLYADGTVTAGPVR